MPAAKLNLQVEQNATYKKRFIWRDKNRRAINLQSYTALMQIRSDYNSTAIAYELSTENGRIELTSGGVVDLTIPASATKTMQAGVYDVLLIAPDGTSTRLVEGKIVVSRGSSVKA